MHLRQAKHAGLARLKQLRLSTRSRSGAVRIHHAEDWAQHSQHVESVFSRSYSPGIARQGSSRRRFRCCRSRFAQHQINHPAPAHVPGRPFAVVAKLPIGTSGILLDRPPKPAQIRKFPLVVDGPGDGSRRVVETGGIKRHRAERVAENVCARGAFADFSHPSPVWISCRRQSSR